MKGKHIVIKWRCAECKFVRDAEGKDLGRAGSSKESLRRR